MWETIYLLHHLGQLLWSATEKQMKNSYFLLLTFLQGIVFGTYLQVQRVSLYMIATLHPKYCAQVIVLLWV